MGQTEKIIAGLEPPALEGLTRAPFPVIPDTVTHRTANLDRQDSDAIQTILHETVAHKGLRELMGDRFNEFINRVYESLDAEASPYVLNNQRRQVQQTISRILKSLLTFLIP